MSTAAASVPLERSTWRSPLVLILVGCVIALIAFGPRSALGQFLTPLSFDRGWGREAFSFAIAVQNLLWGAAQPFAGGIADRFGPTRVLCAGAILYAIGLAWMSQVTTVAGLDVSAGVLMGFGLAGCSFPMVIGALGKLVPENWRGFAFGAGTAAGSFGQFLYSPLAAALIHAFSWQPRCSSLPERSFWCCRCRSRLRRPNRHRLPQPQSRSRRVRRSSKPSATGATCC